MRIRFTDFVVDTEARQLERDGVPVHLSPKALTALLFLLERRPNAVSKRELLDRVWPGVVVEERNVKNIVAEIRSALGDDSEHPALVRTVQRFGYAFSADATAGEGRSGERRSGPRMVAAGAFAIVSIAIAVWILSTRKSSIVRAPVPFEKMRMTRMSTAGNVSTAAISPDGKLFAYGTEGGAGTLWVGQTASESRSKLVSTNELNFADAIYGGFTFSPDQNYIYYTSWTLDDIFSSLMRIPTIGGPATKLLSDVDSPVAFSPDGTQFVFARGAPLEHKTMLVVANADGSNAHAIFTRNGGEFTQPSWSPDGRTIAAVFNNFLGRITLESIDIRSGKSFPVGPTRWSRIGRIAWLADGKALLLTAQGPGEQRTDQLWLTSYPDGSSRRITHDPNDYRSLTLSKDAKLLVVQTAQTGQLWVASATGGSARELPLDRHAGLDDLSWTAAGEIVYTSIAGKNQDVWRIDPRSGISVPVMKHHGFDGTPVECGTFMVFSSTGSSTPGVLARADRDGRNVVRLTEDPIPGAPLCSNDGQWVFYCTLRDNGVRAWKVSIRGTTAQLVTPDPVVTPMLALSPDGRYLAFISVALSADNHAVGKAYLEIVDVDRGSTRRIECPPGFSVPVQWTPDGKALAYVDSRGELSNLWRLPLDGKPATPITRFDSGERLMRFAFSRDGKQLALVRGWQTSEVVLIDP